MPNDILKFVTTEKYQFDRDKVLDAANALAEAGLMDVAEWMDLDDIITEVFELTFGSKMQDDALFYQYDTNSVVEYADSNEEDE